MTRVSASTRLSGRFLLRIGAHLHERLQGAARSFGVSLNELCTRQLSVPGPAVLVEQGAAASVERSLTQFGAALAGVLVYGSYARGDAAAASDVDLLVVVDPAIPLTRTLYRDWDVEPVEWQGRHVDPHFIHLPTHRRTAPGAWCEAAIDGVVLYERDGAVTRHLAAIRGDIAAGRLVRRSAHGQPYWTEAA
jgi:predicted nucleotidyltransferase